MQTFQDRSRKVLCVEQDHSFLAQCQQISNQNCSFETVTDGLHALQRVEEDSFDLVVLAYNLENLDGLKVLERLLKQSQAPPVVFLVEEGKDEKGVEALKMGAVDYLVKDKQQKFVHLLHAVMHTAYIKHHAAKDLAPSLVGGRQIKFRASRAKTERRDFLARASHEIRTPMNAVFGLAQLLLQTKLDTRQTEMAETLKANADILLKLVEDLIDLSRLESGHLKLEAAPFGMGDIFKDLSKAFAAPAASKNLTLSLTDLTDGQFIGDRVRLLQILTNLVGNAVKFTASGGVTVSAEASRIGPEQASLLVTVTDSGMGIEPSKWETIFTRFTDRQSPESRGDKGCGLGLAISKSLTELMRGELSVQSDINKGSVFSLKVSLPLFAVHKPAKEERSEPASDRVVRGTVLIVEDYPASLMVASLMLEHLGYAAEAAANGEEALRRVALRKAPYIAILMDVQMPDIDGFETTKRIRELEKAKGFSHHIIGVTAHALAGDRERCLEAGMNQYMSKPVHPDILAQKLALLADAA